MVKIARIEASAHSRPFEGRIEPHDAPGLGLDIDEAMLADYPAVPGPCYLPGR